MVKRQITTLLHPHPTKGLNDFSVTLQEKHRMQHQARTTIWGPLFTHRMMDRKELQLFRPQFPHLGTETLKDEVTGPGSQAARSGEGHYLFGDDPTTPMGPAK